MRIGAAVYLSAGAALDAGRRPEETRPCGGARTASVDRSAQ